MHSLLEVVVVYDIKRGEKYNFLSRRSDKEEGIDVRTPQDSNLGHPCPRWGVQTNVDTWLIQFAMGYE